MTYHSTVLFSDSASVERSAPCCRSVDYTLYKHHIQDSIAISVAWTPQILILFSRFL